MPRRLPGEMLDEKGAIEVLVMNHYIDEPHCPYSGTTRFPLDPDTIRASIEALTAQIAIYEPSALPNDSTLLTMKEQLRNLVSTVEGFFIKKPKTTAPAPLPPA